MSERGFGPISEIDDDSMYKFSFGDIPDKTMYDGPMQVGSEHYPDLQKAVMDWYEKNMPIRKAANVGAASGAAGYVPMPLMYDPGVIDITRRFTPIKALIPKVTNKGLTANYYRLTARGAAAWGAEDPALNEVDDTEELASETIKYARVVGRVTGVAEIGGAHFESAMRRAVLNKTQTLNELIEEALLVGNNTSNEYQPNGLDKLITKNKTNMSGAIPTLEDVDTLVNDCFVDKGAPNLLITDPYTASHLKNQIMQYVKYQNPYTKVAWGLQGLSINTVVGELPLIASQFMPITADARKIFCVNTNFLEQRVLQDITFERLAKTTDSNKFFLKIYMTLINKFPEGMGMLYGCD
jgi:hypothetical protein